MPPVCCASQERLLVSEVQNAKKTQKKLREEMAMEEERDREKEKERHLDERGVTPHREVTGHYAYNTGRNRTNHVRNALTANHACLLHGLPMMLVLIRVLARSEEFSNFPVFFFTV